MSNGHKGGLPAKQQSAHDTDALAMSTFVGGDDESERQDDDHEERHEYYRDLAAKQKSGKALTDTERQWMQQAVDAHHTVTRKGQLPGELSKFNVDDAAMKAFGTGSPFMGMPRGREMGAAASAGQAVRPIDNVNSIGNPGDQYDLSRARETKEGVAIQNLEALQRPGIPRGFNTGYTKSLGQPQVSVGDPMQQNVLDAPPAPRGKGPIVIRVNPDDPVGMDETGEDVNLDGKYLGSYAPPVDQGRYLNRSRGDVYDDDKDKFATDSRKGKTSLDYHYGEHLKAVEDNDGKYPAGYFRGMDEKRKKEIKEGVHKLMLERKGTKA